MMVRRSNAGMVACLLMCSIDEAAPPDAAARDVLR